MSSDAVARLSEFYLRYRILEQQAYYDGRRNEYEAANSQLTMITTALLLLAAAAGVLATVQFGLGRAGWGIVAAACSALATVATGWATIVGFRENARLYRGASIALDRLAGPLQDRPADQAALIGALVQAEEILQSETSQWGQQLKGSAAQVASQSQSAGRAGRSADGPDQPAAQPPG
jgi:hypothetical protein